LRSLAPEEAAKFERFVAEYELVRAAESRGSTDPAYYLALPFQDLTGKLSSQWKIRAVTFRYIERHILEPLAARRGRPLRILDLGAGNGWLSYRLSLLGHQPVAVDILVNEHDGLGAAMHYANHLPSMFPRVQASLDRLPFQNAAFDLAIFNASFHYSTHYATTLAEALRCTRKDGRVVIADTPWYRHEASGLRMVEEKRAYFKTTYGFASDSLPSQEFLTPQRLDDLASALKLEWSVLKPFYGVDWALRPLRAKLARRRPPSRFHIFVAEVFA
jgi:SAM-dependent methyltransferase